MLHRTLACLALAAAVVSGPGASRAASVASPDSGSADATPLPVLQPPPVPVVATPPDFPRGRISGVAFGDLYYNVDGDPRHAYSPAGADSGRVAIDNSGKPITRDLNGLAFRRIFFQLDNDLSIRVATRLRFEMDGRSLTSDGKIGLSLKAAYVQVKSVYPRADLVVGMFSTQTWEVAEDLWQYRSIEKTVGDFRGFAGSTDMGIVLRGWADGDHHVGYVAALGNGNGQSPENNRQKRAYLSFPLRFGDLRAEPYADYEHGANGLDRATYHLTAGYGFRRVTVGAEWYDRVNHRNGTANQEPRAYSLFARASAHPQVTAFARVDDYTPDHRAANRVDSRLWIAGVDWEPFKDVHFMPNIEAQQYRARGSAVAPSHHDLQARVTFYYRFSRPQS